MSATRIGNAVLVEQHPIMARMHEPRIRRAFELGVLARSLRSHAAGSHVDAPFEAGTDQWLAWQAAMIGPKGRLPR